MVARMKNEKQRLENSVLVRIFEGEDFDIKDNNQNLDQVKRSILGARQRLINKGFITKKGRLTEKGLAKCVRMLGLKCQ